ncbi:S1 RNA-binding domain-containing protein [Brevibacillus sp. HB2.2]|nr:S1 RNA-binding domain-containing protein [Brevibacillus sp. HB2.2]
MSIQLIFNERETFRVGAFVHLPGDVTGLVHISEIADVYVRDIHPFLKISLRKASSATPLSAGTVPLEEKRREKGPQSAFFNSENYDFSFFVESVF